MFDIGWTELLVIGALALIVVGPRELPQLLRTIGQTVGKIKRMAREFQRSMEDAARESDIANFDELRDLKKDVSGLDFRQQASKARSYLNQPVKTEPGGAKAGAAGAAGGAAAQAEASADAPPTVQSAPADAGESDPAESKGSGAAAPKGDMTAEAEPPRQAGAKG